MDESSSELVLLDDTDDIQLQGDQINLGMPGTSRVNKRKVYEDVYSDDDAGLSKLKYFKPESSDISRSPFLPKTKSDTHLIHDGNYYITVASQYPGTGIVSDVLGEESSETADEDNHILLNSDDENGNRRIVLLDRDDWNICSIKEAAKSGGNIHISVPITPISGTSDIEEEVADLPDDPVRTTWVTTKADKIQLKNSGHTWKTGKWKREEISLLKENIEKFCADHNIADPQQIIYHATKEERKNFYPTISQGLNRPIFAVYRRVKRMYDLQNYRGKYTEEEVKQLRDLHAKYGRDWTVIGQHMGRSSDSVKDRCRLFHESERVTGKWTNDEEARLAEAVYAVTGEKPGTSITADITWQSVADTVGTRTEKQCRAKWLNYLNWKLCNGDDWRKTNDRLLVEKLTSMNITSEEEINWKKLSDGLTSSRSPQWLRGRWWHLKKLYLSENPNVTSITLRELLEQLHEILSKQILNSWERSTHNLKVHNKKNKNNSPLYVSCMANGSSSDSLSTTLDRDADKGAGSSNVYTSDVHKLAQAGAEHTLTLGDDSLTQVDFDGKNSRGSGTQHGKVNGETTIAAKQREESRDDKSAESYITTDNQKEPHDLDENTPNTVRLTPTSNAGVFLLQNAESSNPLLVFLSDDIDNVNITVSPEMLSLLNRTSKVESEPQGDDMGTHHCHDTDATVSSADGMRMVHSHHDVITTSDVLVYQETVNDDDIKNPILSSAIHEVVTVSSHDNEDDDCFIQNSSSPLQGTLLEGTDLASATIRIDGTH